MRTICCKDNILGTQCSHKQRLLSVLHHVDLTLSASHYLIADDDDVQEGASFEAAQQADSRHSMLKPSHISQKPLQTWPRQDLPKPLAQHGQNLPETLAQPWQDGEPQQVGAAVNKAEQDFAKWMTNAHPQHAEHAQEQQAASSSSSSSSSSSHAQQVFVDHMQQQQGAISDNQAEQSYSDFMQQQVMAARTAEQIYKSHQDKNGFPYLKSDASKDHLRYASLGD